MQNRQHGRDLHAVSSVYPRLFTQRCLPAPITTLESPLHNDQKPSARDIVTMALEMPLYMALGDGLTICILVYRKSAHCWQWTKSLIKSCAP